ncbi:hypothetical protein [Bradymonas sediminis]|nr:hypothetical protein [Bradymonas sediminis]TDP77380.1 hypothetical protein DFR33_101280 [Bradymonas sediminis]
MKEEKVVSLSAHTRAKGLPFYTRELFAHVAELSKEEQMQAFRSLLVGADFGAIGARLRGRGGLVCWDE